MKLKYTIWYKTNINDLRSKTDSIWINKTIQLGALLENYGIITKVKLIEYQE